MKKIVYKNTEGGISIVHPAEGSRLATKITFNDGRAEIVASEAVPVDSFLRGWPVEGATAEWAEQEEAFLSRIIKKVLPEEATNVRVIEPSEIPTDRTFRNAWKDEGGSITVDMPQAREIHRDYLRKLREPKLAALDIEYMRALETGNIAEQERIAAEKQLLRDATAFPAIDAATTPEELKAAIPPVLL